MYERNHNISNVSKLSRVVCRSDYQIIIGMDVHINIDHSEIWYIVYGPINRTQSYHIIDVCIQVNVVNFNLCMECHGQLAVVFCSPCYFIIIFHAVNCFEDTEILYFPSFHDNEFTQLVDNCKMFRSQHRNNQFSDFRSPICEILRVTILLRILESLSYHVFKRCTYIRYSFWQ